MCAKKSHWLPASIYIFLLLFPKNFALVCSFSVAEHCSSLVPSRSMAALKFRGIWSSRLQNETKSICNLKKGQTAEKCRLSLPMSNRDPCTLESLPHNCKKCLPILIRQSKPHSIPHGYTGVRCMADTFPLVSCVLSRASHHFWNYILTHTLAYPASI